MNDRTMLMISASGRCVSLRTFSRKYCSPHRFIIPEDELERLEDCGDILASDILSFAKLSVRQTWHGDILEIRFTWLDDAGGGKVSGMTESVRVPYGEFVKAVEESRKNSVQARLLSMKDTGRPKIEFQGGENLRAVVQSKPLRKKLGKFLSRNFAGWEGSRLFSLYNDYDRYSFFFKEQTVHGIGMCGGVILHGLEKYPDGRLDTRKAHYEIHT